MNGRLVLIPLTGALLVGCSLTPVYLPPSAPIPQVLPPQTGGDAAAARGEVFADPRLTALMDQASATNRDLRRTLADVAAARALYRIEGAQRLPQVSGTADVAYVGGDAGSERDLAVGFGINAFELDLFGRVQALTGAALERYLATEEAARAVRLTLEGDIAEAWLTHAQNATLLRISQEAVANAEASVRLIEARRDAGVASRTELSQAQTILASTQADVADLQALIGQDRNALRLLIGAEVDPALLADDLDVALNAVRTVAAGTDSAVLLGRPDVMQAEHALRAAYADIGAARAALFPRISLTAAAGVASGALSSLFDGGVFSYSATPSVSVPIFQAGAGRAGVAYAEAQRDGALADYEHAIQTAFRETADALAREAAIGEQLRARTAGVTAADDAWRLADARYRGGVDGFLTSLDAQRSLYSARQSLAATQFVAGRNRIALYRALGGGRKAPSA